MKKIVFFGLGAVGSVMARCLYELCQRNGNKKFQFIFIVRDPKKARQYLFKASHILKTAQFLTVKNFNAIFQNPKKYSQQLSQADIFINTAIPEFNELILKLAIKFKVPYTDLASDMYNERTLKTLKFPQQNFHKQLKQSRVFGLINNGISPGVTNFLVGEKFMQMKESSQCLKIKGIHVYLLEHINSDQIVFSWSPKVALEELEQKPRYVENKKLITIEPFSKSQSYQFPHCKESINQYPIYQEEILSFRDSYPKVQTVRVSSGGSEVQLIKNLFQLNLLSKKNIECIKTNMSIEQIVRKVLPSLQSPQKIENMLSSGIIKHAQFAAMVEITIEVKNCTGKTTLMTETAGLSFHQYSKLLGTPYSGATYISYPTGISAAILLFYTHKLWQENKQQLSGILKTEQLPSKMGPKITDEIKREICSYMIDFVSHSHSLVNSQ